MASASARQSKPDIRPARDQIAGRLLAAAGAATTLALPGEGNPDPGASAAPCYIPLTQGKQVRVDAADYAYLSMWVWTYDADTGYACRTGTRSNGKRRKVYLHRAVMKARPFDHVDHWNQDKLDCRQSNLRVATPQQNSRNVGVRAGSTSGVTGVNFDYVRRLWRAYITVDGHQKFLGYAPTRAEAAALRRAAELQYFGSFAPVERQPLRKRETTEAREYVRALREDNAGQALAPDGDAEE